MVAGLDIAICQMITGRNDTNDTLTYAGPSRDYNSYIRGRVPVLVLRE